MNPDMLKGNLEMMLLAVVARAPAHGYAVIEDLRRQSGGAFDLPEGTVYPALHRLEKQGLLESRWSTAAARKRRLYEITMKGAAELRGRERQWSAFSRAVRSVMKEKAWAPTN
ncbi:MAG: helix-turn-helix transcriptional regulator [Dehalococcoidia bacterium]